MLAFGAFGVPVNMVGVCPGCHFVSYQHKFSSFFQALLVQFTYHLLDPGVLSSTEKATVRKEKANYSISLRIRITSSFCWSYVFQSVWFALNNIMYLLSKMLVGRKKLVTNRQTDGRKSDLICFASSRIKKQWSRKYIFNKAGYTARSRA